MNLLVISCGKKSSDDDFQDHDNIPFDTCRCVFVNKSGVEVAVVVMSRGGCAYSIDFPDSLVLKPGIAYGWDVYYPSTKYSPVIFPYPPLGDILWTKLYFDKTIDVDLFYKDLHSLYYYEEDPNPGKYKNIYTYTFTKEDYLWALDNNKQTE